ncbi:Glycosyl hydrolases family 2, TIM barrel domain [Abditibacterium utsteinense]|uniref:Glycosyl hydrolases family 2, TIM barrel domain n=1 Tax=Abditibacterium utsteinense TaxID=1960156 RepID=A0A2S8SQK7_9BACT|nr:glycoside hydrolase family 2 TIM barrel-domain containing protein [Abditibacterium utsteinense]PQV63094.1 Glycosyl hydrolases family 2, TIM barrel domain [Abditibacterium utsteinense]
MSNLSTFPLRAFPIVALSLLSAGCNPVSTPSAGAAPLEVEANTATPTQLVQNGEKWQLMRNGQAYFIKGVGGDGSKEALKTAGGNSFRTWGADNLEKQLNDAQKLGLTVTVGIWLGHKEHGFDYHNAQQVADQLEGAKRAIDRTKNHPALLMWGIGNEMENGFPDDDPAVWQAVEQIAAYAKKVDPNHPTMTVIAEIGGKKVANINKYCSDIDVIGINSYAGGPSMAQRYLKAGGIKPYVMTEFGPPGTWELPKNSWGTVEEPTSTQKAEAYRATYEKSILASPLSLGSYAFTWGNKQEASATWFGLLLNDGTRLAPVDALTQLWTGKLPTNRVPQIESLKLQSAEKTQPGAIIKASLKAVDPEKDALKVEWVLQHDPMQDTIGGETQAVPPTYPEAIQSATNSEVTLKMPQFGGGYRLFAFIRDGKGGGAVGNLPLYVQGGEKMVANAAAPKKPDYNAPQAKLPLEVLGESAGAPSYFPSGYMGQSDAIKMVETSKNPHSGKSALEVKYLAKADWGGVVWQSPAEDWGDKPGGWNLSGAKKLTFWARGEKGGEEVAFSFGLLGADKKYPDSDKGETGKVKLNTEWQQFTLDLTGKDLTHIKTGFCWVVASNGQPTTFYLDDIKFE